MDLLINLSHNGLEINMFLFLTKWKPLSCVRVFATPWTIPSMGFSRPEYRDLPNPGTEPRSPTLQADSSPADPQGKRLFLKISRHTFCLHLSSELYRLSWRLSRKEPTCQWRRGGFDPWVGKIPWRRKWQPTLVFLPGKSHGQRSLAGYSPWSPKELGRSN